MSVQQRLCFTDSIPSRTLSQCGSGGRGGCAATCAATGRNAPGNGDADCLEILVIEIYVAARVNETNLE
jgi:hypothetical protein